MFLFDSHNDFVCRFLEMFPYASLKSEMLYFGGALSKMFFLLLLMIFSNSGTFPASSGFSAIFTFYANCFVIR